MEVIQSRGTGFTLKPVKSDEMPTRIFVSAFCADSELDIQTGVEYYTLKSIATARLRWRNAEFVSEGIFSSHDPRTFWEEIYKQMSGGGTYWLFCYRLYELFMLTRGDCAIESGMFEISGERTVVKQDGTEEKVRMIEGTVILDDPPSIIEMKRRGGGRLIMIDFANYGMVDESSSFSNLTVKLCNAMGDLAIIYQCCHNFKLGSLRRTAASQGFYAYRRNHLSDNIYIHPFADIVKLERDSYYGGRCEAFKIGLVAEEVFLVDVNSMYLYLAGTSNFPTKLHSYHQDMAVERLKYYCQNYMAIARCVISTDKPAYPVVEDDLTIWPVGKFETCLAHYELVQALNENRIVSVSEVALYEHAKIFKSWSESILSARSELRNFGIKNGERFIKAVGVNLFGKLAQTGKEWKQFERKIKCNNWEMFWSKHPDTGKPTPFRCIDGTVQYLNKDVEPEIAFPAIPACLNSLGRCMLQHAIDVAVRENVLYCDTDSLIVKRAGFNLLSEERMIHQTQYGCLKVVETGSKCEIKGWKFYKIGDKSVCAGVKGKLEEFVGTVPTWREIVGFANSMWNKDAFNAKSVIRQNTGQRSYRHGNVGQGGEVYPFNINVVDGSNVITEFDTGKFCQ